MSILIDGYNLLHASGVMPRGKGPGGLERLAHCAAEFAGRFAAGRRGAANDGRVRRFGESLARPGRRSIRA